MEYPDFVFLASADPLHYSHLNTINLAERKLRKTVCIVICRNELKDGGMFSLDERAEIARNYTDAGRIFTASSPNQIRAYIKNCKKVVRGIKSINDIQYTLKLAFYYKVLHLCYKITLIPIPQIYQKISSTNLKNLVKDNMLSEAERYAPIDVVKRVQDKLLVGQKF